MARQALDVIAKRVGTVAIPTAAVGAAGMLGKEIFIDPMQQKKIINQSYTSMLQKTPQLAGEDQDKIRDYFDVVKSFSPHAAANPLVAGSIVNKMVQFGGIDHKLVQDLVALEEGTSGAGLVTKMLEGGVKVMTGIDKKG
jgi:hypothetical protein